nr:NAD(P)-dependent oxidoreductase [Pseudactinotalea sp. HY160]
MAGTDSLHAAGFAPGVPILGGVGLHDVPVAEHTLALLLAAARRLDQTTLAQQRSEWFRPLSGNQTVKRTGFTQISGARVTIWGFGGIAAVLAGYLSAMGAQVTGVARSAGDRHGHPVVTPDDLPRILPATDALVSILPGTAATDSIISREVFGALPAHAWFVNVGRGSVVDDDALLEALRAGTIAGAALDVFRTEPLPADSPLWAAPNLILTPHSAGGRPQHPGRLIEENLRRHLAGEELLGRTHP